MNQQNRVGCKVREIRRKTRQWYSEAEKIRIEIEILKTSIPRFF